MIITIYLRRNFSAVFKLDGRIFTPKFGLSFCLTVNNILKLFTFTMISLFSFYNCSLKIKDTHLFSWDQGRLTLKSSRFWNRGKLALVCVVPSVHSLCPSLPMDTWPTFLVYFARNRLNPLSFGQNLISKRRTIFLESYSTKFTKFSIKIPS